MMPVLTVRELSGLYCEDETVEVDQVYRWSEMEDSDAKGTRVPSEIVEVEGKGNSHKASAIVELHTASD
ncbi:unnamed protein product [Arabis nemorensis]|uniref:Uncharacterized protein n=1 Tax=Arabis nemorensis TaxID=586526 RepID=A0A565C6R7_9BRAS|nr:unnamed protein product [Arabis nemorensis]